MSHSILGQCRRVALLAVGLLALAVLLRPGLTAAQEPEASTFDARFDLTGNQVVNASDAWAAIAAWSDLQPDGLCLTPEVAGYDVDGSGCLDVADVQLVLNEVGASALPEVDERAVAALVEFTVNSAGDEGDSSPGNGLCQTRVDSCTLRAALQESNIRPGPETVSFDVRNPDGSCPSLVTLQPASYLTIDDAYWDGVTIDGYTQCGASPNTLRAGGNAQIKIEIRGSPSYDGIRINTPHNVIRGLAIYNFARQLRFYGPATHTEVQGNFLGTNAANTFVQGLGSSLYGLSMLYTPAYNVIGCGYYDANNQFVGCLTLTEVAAARNIVAGNGNDGINIEGRVHDVRIIGNHVGVAQNGRTALRNGSDGVDLGSGPYNNWIGGSLRSYGNVISGNSGDGIEMSHDTRT
ncbi:MAG TPA: CSLREA domain-containing protein, partial [Ardenticatenaceae bacterium]